MARSWPPADRTRRSSCGTWPAANCSTHSGGMATKYSPWPSRRMATCWRHLEPMMPSSSCGIPRSLSRPDSIREPILPVGVDADGSLVAFLEPELRPVVLDPVTVEASHLAGPNLREDVGYYLTLNSVSADGRFQGVWAVDENIMEVWDRREGKRLCTVPAFSPKIAFAPGRQLISTVTTNHAGEHMTTIWDLPSGTVKWTFAGGFDEPDLCPRWPARHHERARPAQEYGRSRQMT
jgi:hypothetical protein